MPPRSTLTADIEGKILVLRGQKVMLDADLAALYGVTTGALMQAVMRNRERFPPDFMLALENQEVTSLKSQIVISKTTVKPGRGGRRKAAHGFTEQGVAMLSSVLRSPRAVAANIAIMRAFVRLRAMVAASAELSGKLDELERRVSRHDESIATIVRAIRQLAIPPAATPKRSIGFVRGR